MQRALIQYRNPKNYHLVREALEKAKRTDLIGYDKKCLIRPRKGEPIGKPLAKVGKPPITTPGMPVKPPKAEIKGAGNGKTGGGKGTLSAKSAPAKGKKDSKTPLTKGKPTPKLPTPLQMARAEQYLKKRKK
jgi:hypothetical protein